MIPNSNTFPTFLRKAYNRKNQLNPQTPHLYGGSTRRIFSYVDLM